MTPLQVAVASLIPKDICFEHTTDNRLQLHSVVGAVSDETRLILKESKPLLLGLIPTGATINAKQLDNVLECYEERTAILWHGGTGIALTTAKQRAINDAHDFLVDWLEESPV